MTRLRRWRFHQLGSQAGQGQAGQEGPAGGGQEGERWMMRRAGPSGWELLAAAGRVSSSGTVVPQVPAAPEVAPWCCTTTSGAHHDGADQWDEPAAPLTWPESACQRGWRWGTPFSISRYGQNSWAESILSSVRCFRLSILSAGSLGCGHKKKTFWVDSFHM